jgi:hypothetical protein
MLHIINHKSKKTYLSIFILLFFALCSPRPDSTAVTYDATITFQDPFFSGASLSEVPVLILPIVKRNMFDTSETVSPLVITQLLQTVRKDIVPVYKSDFEAAYLAKYDSTKLADFYKSLCAGDMLALANSETVWKQMHVSYCCVTRMKNAVTIKDFDDIVKRRMILETELWNADSSAVVFRVEVKAGARGARMKDDEFVKAALNAAFAKLPVFSPANNEKNW